MVQNILNTLPNEILGGLSLMLIIYLANKGYTAYKNIRLAHKYKSFIDKYDIHIFSSEGKNHLTPMQLTIKRKFGALKIYSSTRDFHYTGEIKIDERNTYIYLNGKYHSENIMMVFHTPLHRKLRYLWGTGSGVSVLGEPIAYVCLLSHKKMNENEVRKAFANKGLNHHNSTLKIHFEQEIYTHNATVNAVH